MFSKLLILGDISFDKNLEKYYSDDTKSIFGELNDYISSETYVIGNLECPITEEIKPIKKAGPTLKITKENFNKICESNISALSLANNHILDYGVKGLTDTITCLKDKEIKHFGISQNKETSYIITEIAGKKVGMISFAEKEFNYSKTGNIGAQIFNPYTSLSAISELKKKVDYVVVIYHGGIEHYSLPSPMLQERCRAIVDFGADLVTCQHSHCIGAFEHHNNSFILYGQGNTVFGHRSSDAAWNEGLTIEIDFEKSEDNITLIHHVFTNEGIVKSDSTQCELRLKELTEASKNVKSDIYIEKKWAEFCQSKQNLYLPLLYGWQKNFIRANRVLKNRLASILITKKMKMVTNNIIRCDSHREVINTLLEKK